MNSMEQSVFEVSNREIEGEREREREREDGRKLGDNEASINSLACTNPQQNVAI